METRAMVVGLVEGGAAACTEGDGAAHEIKQLVEPVRTYIITPSNHPSSTSLRDWKLRRCCSPHRHWAAHPRHQWVTSILGSKQGVRSSHGGGIFWCSLPVQHNAEKRKYYLEERWGDYAKQTGQPNIFFTMSAKAVDVTKELHLALQKLAFSCPRLVD